LDTNFRGFSLAKYTTQFKLEVIGRYLVGDIGFASLSRLCGVDYSQVKRWVHLYQAHGEAGITKKHTSFSSSQKLGILQYMWASQLSYMQTAAHFNIRSPGVIPAWERCYHSGGIDALSPRQRGRPKKMPELPPPKPQAPADDDTPTREELLAEVNYLRMENAYLKKLKALVQQQQAAAPKKRR
jgi:transposase